MGASGSCGRETWASQDIWENTVNECSSSLSTLQVLKSLRNKTRGSVFIIHSRMLVSLYYSNVLALFIQTWSLVGESQQICCPSHTSESAVASGFPSTLVAWSERSRVLHSAGGSLPGGDRGALNWASLSDSSLDRQSAEWEVSLGTEKRPFANIAGTPFRMERNTTSGEEGDFLTNPIR